jgi:hypothetical protein
MSLSYTKMLTPQSVIISRLILAQLNLVRLPTFVLKIRFVFVLMLIVISAMVLVELVKIAA